MELEIWDAYNEKEELLGVDLIRGEEIPEDIYHIVVEVLVRHIDGEYLLMKRSFDKVGWWLGYYEATAGGSALKGETAEIAIVRETYEETGVKPKELELINKAIGHPVIFYSFLGTTDCDKDSITLQEGETIGYKWLTEADFITFMKSDKSIPTQRDRMASYLEKISSNTLNASL